MKDKDCCSSNKPSKSYDLVVVGAGSAGFSAAITAAEQGARVALIGYGKIGGTCVNIGCVPSKTLIRATENLHQAHTASRFNGLHVNGRMENWGSLIAQKDDLVSSLRQAKYIDLLSAYSGITYLEGQARLTSIGVTVNGNPVNAGKIIIATGARPAKPSIPGIANVPYLTSTTALDLNPLPHSLLVIGGGYIGCELAQMFRRAGVVVTLVFRSRLLPKAEPEISDALTGYFKDEGISVLGGMTYERIKYSENKFALQVTQAGVERTLAAEKVLVTTSRTPNTENFGLDKAGIIVDSNGAIVVDDRMQTSQPGIYAAGDVTGRDQFVYMAAYGAKIAANNALNGDNRKYDNRAMPTVAFTDPQAASVGFTEARAKAAGYDVCTSLLPLKYLPRALAARDTRGIIKLVAEAENKRLLGAHILAPEGADSIQTAALAIKQGLSVNDLAEMIFPYLTTVEGLKLAAQAFEKDVAKLSCCAG